MRRNHAIYRRSIGLPKTKTYEDYLREAGYVRKHGSWIPRTQSRATNEIYEGDPMKGFRWGNREFDKREKNETV